MPARRPIDKASMRAEKTPPRRVADIGRRALKRLPIAVLIAAVVSVGLMAAIPLLPGQYWSNAVLLIGAREDDATQRAPLDAAARSALIDREIATLNSLEMRKRITAELKRRSPEQAAAIAQGPEPKDPAQRLNVRRRSDGLLVDVSADGPNPIAAQAIVAAAVEAYQFGQLDRRLAEAEAVPSAAPTVASADPQQALATLEAERDHLLAQTAAPAEDANASAARAEQAQARADVSAVRGLVRSDVEAADIGRLRASGVMNRLGAQGEKFAQDLAAYEAVLASPEAERQPDNLRFLKYQILTQASQIADSLDERVSRLAATAAPSAASAPPTGEVASRLQELQGQIKQQREAIQANASVQPAHPAAQQSATASTAVDIRVVSNPSPGATSSWRRPWVLYLAAIAAGGLLGLLYLGIATLASNTVIDARDLAALAGVPVIASLPRVGETQLRKLPPGERHPANFAIEAPASAFADAVRAACESLKLADRESGGMCLAITGLQKGDGATTVSLALARTAASAGLRVLLIDSDFDKAGVTNAMGIEPAAGIDAIFAGDRPLSDLIVEDDMTSVHLLPSAPDPSHRGALSLAQLTSLKSALASAKSSYDLVIIDCEPPSARARTRSMSRMADAGLLVAARNSSKRDMVRLMSRRIRQNGAELLGVMFNYSNAPKRREEGATASGRRSLGAPSFTFQPMGLGEVRSLH